MGPNEDISVDEWIASFGVNYINTPAGLLGQGSRGGVVRLARYRGRCVAVKVHNDTETPHADPPPHSHVAETHERFRRPGCVAEIRALCSGGELFDILAEEGPLPVDQALQIFLQVVQGVAHCHEHGVAHGQLHAEHVLLDSSDSVRLIGMNLPCKASQADCVALRPLRPLDAPELQKKNGSCDVAGLAAADVWAMGLVLITILNGSPPFASTDASSGGAAYTTFLKGGGIASILEESVADALTPPLSEMLTRCLMPTPADRPTARELHQVLVSQTHKSPGSVPSAVLSPLHLPSESYSAGWQAGWQAGLAEGLAKALHGKGGSAERASMPPPRQAPAAAEVVDRQPPLRRSWEQGYVRSLGWQGLPHPASQLVGALRAALTALGVPFSFREEQFLFVVRPNLDDAFPSTPKTDSPPPTPLPPDTMAVLSPEYQRGLHSLVVFVQMFRENADSPRFDVCVKRVEGTSWRFQSFYGGLRTQVSQTSLAARP
jgi:serine/threonine protein kinase